MTFLGDFGGDLLTGGGQDLSSLFSSADSAAGGGTSFDPSLISNLDSMAASYGLPSTGSVSAGGSSSGGTGSIISTILSLLGSGLGAAQSLQSPGNKTQSQILASEQAGQDNQNNTSNAIIAGLRNGVLPRQQNNNKDISNGGPIDYAHYGQGPENKFYTYPNTPIPFSRGGGVPAIMKLPTNRSSSPYPGSRSFSPQRANYTDTIPHMADGGMVGETGLTGGVNYAAGKSPYTSSIATPRTTTPLANHPNPNLAPLVAALISAHMRGMPNQGNGGGAAQAGPVAPRIGSFAKGGHAKKPSPQSIMALLAMLKNSGGQPQPGADNGQQMPAQPSPMSGMATGGTVDDSSSLLVPGDSSGQADDVHAKLSSGEYVIPADVVSGLGDGNNNAGAKNLDGMIGNVRKHKTGGNKFPPKAKKAAQYLKGA